MCLILTAPKGKQKYSEFFLDSIRNGSVTNTDGIGYSFKRDANKDRVWIAKGFTDVEKFISCLKHKRLRDEDELVVHLRIGNRGAKNTDMNHPFVISEIEDEILLNDTYVEKSTICHNGTFIDYGSYSNKEFSDTYFFVRDFIAIPEIQQLLQRNVDLFKKTFKEIIKTNKLAFIFKGESPMVTLGEFLEEDGYYFSNLSYKRKTYRDIGGQTAYWNNEYEEIDYTSHNKRVREENLNRSNQAYRGIGVGFKSLSSITDTVAKEYEQAEEVISVDNHISEKGILLNAKVGKSFGTRTRNSKGLLDLNPSFDIDPPIGIPYFDRRNGRAYYPYFGSSIYICREYAITQVSESKFMPKFFNYKHFTFYCTSRPDSMSGIGAKENELYTIEDFDKSLVSPTHRLIPFGSDPEDWRDDVYVTEDELILFFRCNPRNELRTAYNQVFRLMKNTHVSKNSLNSSNKVIRSSEAKDRNNGITFKKMKCLDLLALKIYNNYLACILMSYDGALLYHNRVQSSDVWVN